MNIQVYKLFSLPCMLCNNTRSDHMEAAHQWTLSGDAENAGINVKYKNKGLFVTSCLVVIRCKLSQQKPEQTFRWRLPERECWWAPSSPETSPWLTAPPPWTQQTCLQTEANARMETQQRLPVFTKSRKSPHLHQVALRREAEAVDGVGPAVGPLAELLGRLGERHVGGDGAVDDGLSRIWHILWSLRSVSSWVKSETRHCSTWK